MPYYRGSHFQPTTSKSTTANTLHIQSLLTDITTSSGCGHTHLLNVPLCFGELSAAVHTAMPSCCLLNLELACYAQQTMQYDWAVYSFSNRHFLSTIESRSLPFTVCLACNTTEAGCSLFTEFAPNVTVFSSGNNLLNHICALGEQSIISGHLINSYCFQTSEVTLSFWKLQLLIIAQLCLIWSLSIVVAIVIPNHDGWAVKSFTKGLEAAHWKVSLRAVSYLDLGDSISNSCSVITAVHSSCTSNVDLLVLKFPPSGAPHPLNSFI